MEDFIYANGLVRMEDDEHRVNFEDTLANLNKYLIIKSKLANDSNALRKYLLKCTIPFTFEKKVNFCLNDVWPAKCEKCDFAIGGKVFPTGNLSPKIIVVGDAPSVHGNKDESNKRAWVYQRSSIILRKSLDKLGVHDKSWYTNLLKCSLPENRPSKDKEINKCSKNLVNEINILKPKIALLLGKHVSEKWGFNIKGITVYHPAYAVRVGMSVDDYSKHIKKTLKEELS